VAGRAIDAPASGWLNLIHVDDAARIVLLAEERAPLPRTYVVSDGQPVLRAEYYAELARLLKAPAPIFAEPPPDSPAAQRAASDKRINPRRMFDELRPTLLYPDYRAGLAAVVGGGD
jgi:nucleoside-diphosphate-sugar epimerase